MMVMGANYRSQYHPKMVGVTGSVGKTTTKQMTYAALSGFGETIKTEGNQNNELGMPRTLMRLESSTEYAVIEMGMSHAGEIDRLARAARPDVGIITCIGVSHIGNLGSQENICKAKLEICNGLPEGAPLVLNYDDPFLRKAALPAHVRPVWFSLSDENADVCALSIRQETDGMSFVLEDQEHGTFVVNIPAMGRHNVANALAAYCAATRLGCDAKRVIRGLSNFEQTGRRQKVVDSEGVTVIEDCYNANPDSMKAALAMFKDFPCKRRFALLGDAGAGRAEPRSTRGAGTSCRRERAVLPDHLRRAGQAHRRGGCRQGGRDPARGQLPRGCRCPAEPGAARRCHSGKGQPRHGTGKSAGYLLRRA